ncbi:MAG: sigma-70 family RNA polymerase sigma factor [Planctomycetes bacterium]|nr:sigma-70 family RNA polymerase sigma factor [Planctomycetota bacterium]
MERLRDNLCRMKPTDTDLNREFARFARSGDPAALGAVYDALAPELLRVALHFSRDAAEAEDLLQSTFVTAIERAHSFEEGRSVKAWLVGILAHHARNARRQALRGPEPERLPRAIAGSPEAGAHGKELDEALDRALADLPEAFRSVLVLRLKHGLTTTEIAEALARPPGTVRSQLARGLDVIRRALPASLAAAFVALSARPARGLDVVRGAVLTHAMAHAPVAISIPFAGGLFAMSKAATTLVAVGILVAVAALWFVARPRSMSAPSRDSSSRIASVERETRAVDESAPGSMQHVSKSASAGATPTVAMPSAAASASTGRLELWVTHEDGGRPASLTIAIVRLTNSPLPYPDERDVATDADGHAVVADLAPGSVTVTCVMGGVATGVIAAGRTTVVRVVVPRGARVLGEVVDAEGGALGGARVWLSEPNLTWRGRFVCTADAHGRFEIHAVTAGQWIGAKGPGWAMSYLQPVDGRAGETMKVRIALDRPGASVHGRVVDGGGAPIPRAHVLVGWERARFERELANGLFGPSGAAQRVVADDDGEFVVDGVPLGRCPLQARADGFGWGREWLDVAPGTNEIRIELPHECAVFGLVADGRGEPVSSARLAASGADVVMLSPSPAIGAVGVTHADPSNFGTATAFADALGRFELRGLPSGDVVVRVTETGARSIQETLRLYPGERRRWDPRLDVVPSITGRVVDERGEPLVDWCVNAAPDDAPFDPPSMATTDARGSFSVEVNEDRSYAVTAYEPQGWSRFPRASHDEARAGDEPLLLEVKDDPETAAVVCGTVLGPGDVPVPEAKVILEHDERKLWRTFDTDSQTGRFEIAHVPPGTLSIDVRANNFPWRSLGSRAVTGGARIDLGVVRLGEGSRLRGRLLDASEERLVGTRIFVTGSDNRLAGTVERRGRAIVSGPLAPGRHTLTISGDGLVDASRAFDVVAGEDTEVDVVLREAGTRRVVVEIADDLPIPKWVSCVVLDPAGRAVCVRSQTPNGARRVGIVVSIPPGIHRVRATTDAGQTAETSVVQEGAGGEADVTLRLGN